MLSLKHHLSLHVPSALQPGHRLAMSPVTSESDELIRAIEEATEQPWELVDTPDVQQLDQFWGEVEDDLKKDPTWCSFAED